MKHINALADRLDALPTRFSKEKVFQRAEVNPRLAYNWLANEPRSWGPWLQMLENENLPVPDPGVSTIEYLGGLDKAKEIFLKNGYQLNQVILWAHEDPRAVENYKRIIYTLNQIENELHGSTSPNAGRKKDEAQSVA